MRVNCKQWEKQAWEHSGKCLIDLYGGYPSPGSCALCEAREPIDPTKPAVDKPMPPPPTDLGTGPTVWGPEFWAAAHHRPLKYKGDAVAELAWITRWGNSLPGGCPCKSGWNEIKAANPPDLASPLTLAKWWHARHNEVNAKLAGKKFVSWYAAVVRWKYPIAWSRS